tara:strand:- start:2433 stop:2927 length:495 start_codon:yes stop_codon:yes gene_type:complete
MPVFQPQAYPQANLMNSPTSARTQAWPLTLYYDGQCPLCVREIRLFQKRNQAARLDLQDISAASTAPLPGTTRDQMMNCLHARFADGHVVSGIDATYWSYHAVGLGWLVKPLGWRWARPFWHWGYRQFCALRPRLAKIIPMPAGSQCEADQCQQRRPGRGSDPE